MVLTHARDILVFIASGLSILLQEFRLDHSYMRFALLAATPFLICVSLVSFLVIRAAELPCSIVISSFRHKLWRICRLCT